MLRCHVGISACPPFIGNLSVTCVFASMEPDRPNSMMSLSEGWQAFMFGDSSQVGCRCERPTCYMHNCRLLTTAVLFPVSMHLRYERMGIQYSSAH